MDRQNVSVYSNPFLFQLPHPDQFSLHCLHYVFMSALSVYLPPREYIKIFVLPSLTSVSFSLGKNNNNHDNLPMAFFFCILFLLKVRRWLILTSVSPTFL